MTGVAAAHPHLKWHEWLKYAVYAALTVNIVLFFLDEWEASGYLFSGEVPLGEIIVAFAASIDTLAWVLLLLLFELETYQIPDEKLTPAVHHTLRVARGACYFFVVYAFYGYLTKALGLQAAALTAMPDLCERVVDGWSVMLDLDVFEPLDAANCTVLAQADALRHSTSSSFVADVETWASTARLAWLDVVNAGTWIFVVALLELDVRLESEHHLIGYWRSFSKAAKYVMYPTLFVAALYWGVVGVFLDFWDAFLWLVAFVFIELNVFEWREERDLRG